MKYLTPEQVLFIHARVIAETGGEQGIRDLGLLQSAVSRPQAVFDGNDLYADVHSKAAALMESLTNNHPFVDGNKRTGFAAAALFLGANGFFLTASNQDVESFVLSVASGEKKFVAITEWLKLHTAESKNMREDK